MEPKTTKKPSRKLVVFKRELPFYLMLIPGVTFLIIFSYLPMFGLVMAFQDFTPLRSFKNSPWVGLKNFRDMLALPTFWNVVGNTLSMPIVQIILFFPSFCKATERCRHIALFSCGQVYLPYCSPPRQYLF